MTKRRMQQVLAALALCAAMLLGASCACAQETLIELSDAGVTVNGEPAGSDPAAAVYTANDIIFYPEGQDFTYGEGEEKDAHPQAEADAHTVVHIAAAGTYRIRGALSAGQIAVDLGEEATEDPAAVVTLILDGANITCTVAPAVIFYNVYECGETDADTATKDVDTSAAGANVIIADGSSNNIAGSYVARIYQSVELSEDGTEIVDSVKLHKYDGAFYSRQSMNVSGGEQGDGVLHITAENEGLDSELHLTISGGVINIASGNDGINTNEDGVSVCAVRGGELNIRVTGETGEGDGIDSNGWLIISGGRVTSSACGFSGDAGIDSDMGIYIEGGEVVAGGNMLDAISGGAQNYFVFQFEEKMPGGTAVTLKDAQGVIVGSFAPANDYSSLIIASDAFVPGTYTLWQGDTQLCGSQDEMRAARPMFDMKGFNPAGMTLPEGFDTEQTPPEGFDPAGMTPPEGFDTEQTPPESFDPAGGGRGRRHDFGAGRGRGFGGGRGASDAERTYEFTLEEGGSVFSGVSDRQENGQ